MLKCVQSLPGACRTDIVLPRDQQTKQTQKAPHVKMLQSAHLVLLFITTGCNLNGAGNCLVLTLRGGAGLERATRPLVFFGVMSCPCFFRFFILLVSAINVLLACSTVSCALLLCLLVRGTYLYVVPVVRGDQCCTGCACFANIANLVCH